MTKISLQELKYMVHAVLVEAFPGTNIPDPWEGQTASSLMRDPSPGEYEQKSAARDAAYLAAGESVRPEFEKSLAEYERDYLHTLEAKAENPQKHYWFPNPPQARSAGERKLVDAKLLQLKQSQGQQQGKKQESKMTNAKKVSIQELRVMVKEAVALQLAREGKKKKSGVEKREDMKDDKEKGDKKKPFGGKQAAPFGSKNEGTKKMTLEQLRGMVKEAISTKLTEMGHEWGTEFEPGEDDSMPPDAGDDTPEPVRSPEQRDKAYNLAMGTDPSLEGWEAKAMEDLEIAIGQLGRLGITKGGRAGLANRVKELESMLNVPTPGRHFAGDREEVNDAYSPVFKSGGAPRQPDAGGPPVGGLMKHDPRRQGGPGVAATTDPVVGHVTRGKEQVPVKRSEMPGRKV